VDYVMCIYPYGCGRLHNPFLVAGRLVLANHRNIPYAQLIIYSLSLRAFEMAFHLGRMLTDLGRFSSVLWRQLGLGHDMPVMTVAPSTLKAFAVLFVLSGAIAASVILRKFVLDGSMPDRRKKALWGGGLLLCSLYLTGPRSLTPTTFIALTLRQLRFSALRRG
jgi:hypothetical protein